jgi:hypothetical protein
MVSLDTLVMRSLHRFLLLLLIFVAAPVCAQTGETPAAPNDRPPALMPLDDDMEPQVTIRQREGAIVEEYRLNGRLYKIKVIPLRGEPYILVDHRGDGSFVPAEGPGTPGLSVPQWVIGTF